MKGGSGLLGHFCTYLAHRIFSNKVHVELENAGSISPFDVPSHLAYSNISWTIFLEVPWSILHSDSESWTAETSKSHFRIKAVVNDDCINVEGKGTLNVVGLFKGRFEDMFSVNKYDCDLADLPVIFLQQVSSQVIRWLHEQALMVKIKANWDFLCLSFELDQGETVSLVAHADPEVMCRCISWWLVMEDVLAEERKVHTYMSLVEYDDDYVEIAT